MGCEDGMGDKEDAKRGRPRTDKCHTNGINKMGVKLTAEEMALCGVGVDICDDTGESRKVMKQNIRHMEFMSSNNDKNWEGINKYTGNDITRMEQNIKSYDPGKTKGSMVAKDPFYKMVNKAFDS